MTGKVTFNEIECDIPVMGKQHKCGQYLVYSSVDNIGAYCYNVNCKS